MKPIESRIDEEHLLSILRTKRFGYCCYALDTIDSTNTFARALAMQGAEEGTVVFAEYQTKGRGRWGRVWHTHKGKSISISLIVRPKIRIAHVHHLTLMVATSISQVLERKLGLHPQLQWPNDVYLGEKKVAGVLTEAKSNRKKFLFAVIGLGLNVNQTAEDFSDTLQSKATSLRLECGMEIDRVSLMAELLFQLEQDYDRLLSKGFDFVLHRWVRRNRVLGKDVTLQTRSGTWMGRVKGFHTNGGLVFLDDQGKEKIFTQGEIIEVKYASGY